MYFEKKIAMQYHLARYLSVVELPLVLFDCDFGDDLEWVYEADWHEDNIRHLQQMWAQHAIRFVAHWPFFSEFPVIYSSSCQ